MKMKTNNCCLLLLASTVLTSIPAMADVRLPKIFTNNMMLQRDQPVRVWGWADAGESVSATLDGKSASTNANESGRWALELPPLKAGENLELAVKGNNTLTLSNIIIGDIWFCSGQSNMEWNMLQCKADEDIKSADLPKIRRIKINHLQAGEPQDDAPAVPWQMCTPGTVGHFTGVGFYFAREVHQQTGVPIGIVDCNWGGTKIEPWVAAEGLGMVKELEAEFTANQNATKSYRAQLAESLTAMEAWINLSRKNLAAGISVTPAPAIPAGAGPSSGIYNAMVHPFVRFPIKGALWYQGESNGNEGETYYDKKRALIGGWRKQWGLGDFPFYFVQLASFQAPTEDPAGGNGFAKIREAQRKSLLIPNTGMAVIIDTVPLAEANNIHPSNKFDVGTRLARWALNRDYGKKDLVPSGPLFKALKIENGTIRLAFDHTGTGLMVGTKEGLKPAAEDSTGKLRRFAIAGADKKWFWAEAVIVNDTVAVSSPEVKEPVAVRYGFEMNPDGANLYNREGLPASPFRSDDW